MLESIQLSAVREHYVEMYNMQKVSFTPQNTLS